METSKTVEELDAEICALVDSIREKLRVANPSKLISYVLLQEDFANTVPYGDDALISRPSTRSVHSGEYLQALLVQQGPCELECFDGEELGLIASGLLADLDNLADLVNEYLMFWALDQKESNPDFDGFPLEAQLMQSVQGDRYYFLERERLSLLLNVHDEELRKLFGIGADEVIEGFERLRYQLTYRKVDAFNGLIERFRKYEEEEVSLSGGMSPEDREILSGWFEDVFSDRRYVVDSSIWPESLMKALSWKVGDAANIGASHDAWPIYATQVKTRPLIDIQGTTYCFDYYALVDNFYRAIQRAINAADPAYKEIWQQRQKEASESAVAMVFEKLLPECELHSGCYYGSKKHRCENDILVRYKDALIVVEVKAGDFTLEPATQNPASHIKRYGDLLALGSTQCDRLLTHIRNSRELILYDKQGIRQVVIDLGEISSTFGICVTVENINSFAARAEKLAFIKMSEGVISIGLDDLMVYKDYFESPLVFLHYLKHRTAATFNNRLALNDELDHLGLYIDKNCYELVTDEYPKRASLIFSGLRADLDNYYEVKGTPLERHDKPAQKTPLFIKGLLKAFENQVGGCPVFGSSLLLDMADRDGVNRTFREAIREQGQSWSQLTGMMLPDGSGSMPIVFFIDSPSLSLKFKEETKRERVATELLGGDYEKGLLLNLRVDGFERVCQASIEFVEAGEIPEERLTECRDRRFRLMAMRGIKAGRNAPCPCGSGIKYKRCHGKPGN